MIPIEVCTVHHLYAEREDTVGKAAAFACHRRLTGSLTKDPREVAAWLESYLDTDSLGVSGFFAAAVMPLLRFDPPIVDVPVVLTGTQYLNCDPTMYPLAAVHGLGVYPGLPGCRFPEIENLLTKAFLSHTIKAQATWQKMRNPSLVGFMRDSEPGQLHVFEQRADKFVRCHEF